jgi:hypothetical protein
MLISPKISLQSILHDQSEGWSWDQGLLHMATQFLKTILKRKTKWTSEMAHQAEALDPAPETLV